MDLRKGRCKSVYVFTCWLRVRRSFTRSCSPQSFTMPRLVPRLVQALKNPETDFLMRPGPSRLPEAGSSARRTKKVSRLDQRLDGLAPLTRPNFTAKGRDKSILLDESNPILHPDAFRMRRVDPLKLWNPAFPERVPSDTVERTLFDEDMRQRANPYREFLCLCWRSAVNANSLLDDSKGS